MFKNRFILVIGVISLVLVTMAVSNPKSNVSLAADQGASDFHQRHPDWTWASNDQNSVIPVTGISDSPDYYQRHPELRTSVVDVVDTTDYFFRHELPSPSVREADMTDYYFRQTLP